jgi:quinol monooxygenase YgiN
MPEAALIVHVHAHVKPDAVDPFKAASVANARASRREPGVVRFDILQDRDDPTRFVLVEIYRGSAAAAAHKETAHYAVWRDAVADLMAEPRRSVKYADVGPGGQGE